MTNRAKTKLITGTILLISLSGLIWVLLVRSNGAHEPQKRIPQTSPAASSPSTSIPLEPKPDSNSRPSTIKSVGNKWAERVFSSFLEKHASARQKPFHRNPPLFERQLRLHLREGRLFALAYPALAESLSITLAEDVTANLFDRAFAIYVLGILGSKGSNTAELTLINLAANNHPSMSVALQGSDATLGSETLRALYCLDNPNRLTGIWRAKCREGDFEALNTVGAWGDPETLPVIRAIAGRAAASNSELLKPAKEAIAQIEILESGDWAVRVERQLLEVAGDIQDNWAEWALKVARMKKLPNLVHILRARLDRGERALQEFEKAYVADGNPSGYARQEFLSSFHIIVTNDFYFDDVLVAYAELGGKLTELERMRLRLFGYACDPTERLAELLAEQR